MDRGCGERLPSLSIPCSPVVQYSPRGQMPVSSSGKMPRSGSVSASGSPEDTRAGSSQLPDIPKYRHGVRNRINGYPHRPLAYGAPQVVRKIFTGQLTPTYFNDICYGRKETPREFMFSTPVRERTKNLWEPKRVSREQARHVIRDIQDARFRKQSQIERSSRKKEKERVKRIEGALMRESEIMPRGLQAYLVKLEKEKEKCDAKIKARKANRRTAETL